MQNASYLRFSLTPLGEWSWYRAKKNQSLKNGNKDRVYSVYKGSESIDYCIVRVVTRINVRVILNAQVCKSDGTFYFGVSRLDGERDIPVIKTAELHASIEKSSSRYQWKPSSGNWEYAPPIVKDKQSTNIQVPVFTDDGGKVPKYSAHWKDQKISGIVDGKTATTNFTIISVNVKFPDTNESNEETVGAFVKTNTPLAVTFQVFPSGLPEELDEFEVNCGDLYKESNASEYSKASENERGEFFVTGGKGTVVKYYKKFNGKQKITEKLLKNLYIICHKPSRGFAVDYVQINHKKSGAKDKASYTGYALSFLTPAGNPEKYKKDDGGQYLKVNTSLPEPADWYVKKEINEEIDSGDGQNEFCFDDGSQKLTIRCEVGINPQLDSSTVKKLLGSDKGVFKVEKLRSSNGDGVPKWDGSGLRSLNREVVLLDGKFKDNFVYEGYPKDNGGFGKYSVSFTFKGETITADYEVFFPKFGTCHPVCEKCPGCQNWFFYWKDGAVTGLADDDVVFANNLQDGALGEYSFDDMVNVDEWSMVYHYIANEIIRISSKASVSGTAEYTLTNRNYGTKITVGKNQKYSGVVTAAAIHAHEKMHQQIHRDLIDYRDFLHYDGYGDLDYLDYDGDGVLDMAEWYGWYYFTTSTDERGDFENGGSDADTYNFSRADPNFSEYSTCGDNEINARMAEREAYGYDIFQDWAKPGCQSKISCGPVCDSN